jgi:hypothetical protein
MENKEYKISQCLFGLGLKFVPRAEQKDWC